MLDINKVRVTVDGLIKKNQISGYLTTSLYNKLAEKVQLKYYNNKRRDWEANKRVTAEMQELSETVVLHPTNGVIVLPTDFWQTDTARLRVFYKVRGEDQTVEYPIEELSNSQWDAQIGSQAFRPDNYSAVLRIRNGNIELLPTSIQEFTFTYLRYPTTPEWAFTTVSSREVYDANNSTQFEVPEEAFDEIVNMFLEEIGLSIRDSDVVQYELAKTQMNGK